MKESCEISEIPTEDRCLSPQTAAVLSQLSPSVDWKTQRDQQNTTLSLTII